MVLLVFLSLKRSLRDVTQTHQVVNTSVQQVVDTVEVEKRIIQEEINQVTRHVEIPPLQFTEKVVDILVVTLREISQLQYLDQVVDVPDVVVAQVPQVHVEMKTVETSQFKLRKSRAEKKERRVERD